MMGVVSFLFLAVTMVWGFPLGETPEQLRASAGAPSNMTQPTPAPALIPGLQSAKRFEVWNYVRDGITYNIAFSNGVSSTISINQMMTSPTLDQTTAPTAPTDPLGVRVGDTAGTILIKSGAVDQINASSGVSISMATVYVRRSDLSYNYQIFSGRVSGEWVTLVTH